MTSTIIITICILLLIAYVFELTSRKTKIPSVILLLLLGWLVRHISVIMEIQIPNLTPLLPVLGTIGLILIVLEGCLELELNKSKTRVIKKSFFVALVPMLGLTTLMAYAFQYFGYSDLRDGFINAIPFCVISSSIAIPSAANLTSSSREFVIYESSLSDIFGILLFNFILINETLSMQSFSNFGLQILLISTVSFIATIGLSYLLSKIQHHIKFAPIILLIILIYAISKIYHLPALLFILLFGIFIGNLDELKHYKWIEKLRPEVMNKEVIKFKEITGEAVFLIRTLFFLLFGYLIETAEILNPATLIWAVAIVAGIFIIRMIFLAIFKLPFMPLLFIAPRGLITILLFFAIPVTHNIIIVNKSLTIQVILLTAFIMMIGLMLKNKSAENTPAPK